MRNRSCDVIIIGGGVMGCTTAKYLLEYEPRQRVTVVEKDPTYQKASTTL